MLDFFDSIRCMKKLNKKTTTTKSSGILSDILDKYQLLIQKRLSDGYLNLKCVSYGLPRVIEWCYSNSLKSRWDIHIYIHF